MASVGDPCANVERLGVLSRFRTDFYRCLTSRADELFELTKPVLCTDGPVKALVGLAPAPEHQRGHGAGARDQPRADPDRPAVHRDGRAPVAARGRRTAGAGRGRQPVSTIRGTARIE